MAADLDPARIKAGIDLRTVIPASPERKVFRTYCADRCVFHPDSNPSLLIYPDGFRCLAGCRPAGDVFDYLMFAHGVSFTEALTLAQSIPATTYHPAVVERPTKKLDQRLGINLHITGLDQTILAYYQQKLGLMTETVVQFQLGFGCLPGKTVPRFTIPIYDGHGTLVNVKARRDDRCPACQNSGTRVEQGQIHCPACGPAPHPDPDWKNKYLSVVGSQPTLFHAEQLMSWYEKRDPLPFDKRTIFLTEGEYKAIAICQAGGYAVSTGPATTFRPEWATLLLATRWQIHLADNDPAGLSNAKLLRTYLPSGKTIFLPNPPKGDPVDYLRPLWPDPTPFWDEVTHQIQLMKNHPVYRVLMGDHVSSPHR